MDTIVIDGQEYVKKQTMGEKFIVRTYSAGVHYGEIVSRNDGEAMLTSSRRLWYWSGAASLNQMAMDGVSKPGDCKFSVRVPEITVLGVIEIIRCSEKAIKSIEAVNEWKK